MKTGAKGGSLKILSEDELERIYQASLSILEDPGIFSEFGFIPGYLPKRRREGQSRATNDLRAA